MYLCQVFCPYTTKDISTLEQDQLFALRMATHDWRAAHCDLQLFTNLQFPRGKEC